MLLETKTSYYRQGGGEINILHQFSGNGGRVNMRTLFRCAGNGIRTKESYHLVIKSLSATENFHAILGQKPCATIYLTYSYNLTVIV